MWRGGYRIGLGLLVGAVLHGTAGAQARDTLRTAADSAAADSVQRVRLRADSLRLARLDSLRADSLMREDLATIRAQQRRADSIKVATPAAEMPRLTEHAGALRWNREQLGASGVLTLGDLLEGVPGVTVFRTGWLASPEQAQYLGDFTGIRIFQDGIELDNLDPRNGAVVDLGVIPLWPLEEVRIERGAFETRVYLQSWRVRSTTPSTRVDIGNGDLQTNAYRGYFGRRFGGGQALQAGGQQFSTRDPRDLGDGDQLSLFGRVGWARGRWGADATFLRTRRERTGQNRLASSPGVSIAPLDLTNADVTARVGFADSSSGVWAQVVAARRSHRQSAILSVDSDLSGGTSTDSTADSTAFSTSVRQYVGAAGWSRRALSVSASLRLREVDTTQFLSPMVRASYAWRGFLANGTAERRDEIGITRLEASGRSELLGRLALSGAISRTSFDDTTIVGAPLAWRGEGAVRVHQMWLGGGMLRRDPVRLPPPILFDTSYRFVADSSATAYFVTARGKLWKDVGVDVMGTMWSAERGYRPKYQSRSRLYIDTDWSSRFPSGNLNILFAVTHEYRTQAAFPLSGTQVAESGQFRLWGLMLEIRLMQATLSYQFRNVLNEQYLQVPGFLNARPTQFYGVRWNFFN